MGPSNVAAVDIGTNSVRLLITDPEGRELERLMVWDPAGDRAHDLERVKRRHTRAGFG